jgi:hypothetical protein
LREEIQIFPEFFINWCRRRTPGPTNLLTVFLRDIFSSHSVKRPALGIPFVWMPFQCKVCRHKESIKGKNNVFIVGYAENGRPLNDRLMSCAVAVGSKPRTSYRVSLSQTESWTRPRTRTKYTNHSVRTELKRMPAKEKFACVFESQISVK